MAVPRDDDILSVAQAARVVGVSAQTIRVALHKGRLRGYRVGPKLYKIRRSDLDRYIRPAVSAGAEVVTGCP